MPMAGPGNSRAERAFAQLASMPRMGAKLGFSDPEIADLRRLQIEGFPRLLILYRETIVRVEVIRVIDAARDIRSLLDDTRIASASTNHAVRRPFMLGATITNNSEQPIDVRLQHRRDLFRWRAEVCPAAFHSPDGIAAPPPFAHPSGTMPKMHPGMDREFFHMS